MSIFQCDFYVMDKSNQNCQIGNADFVSGTATGEDILGYVSMGNVAWCWMWCLLTWFNFACRWFNWHPWCLISKAAWHNWASNLERLHLQNRGQIGCPRLCLSLCLFWRNPMSILCLWWIILLFWQFHCHWWHCQHNSHINEHICEFRYVENYLLG